MNKVISLIIVMAISFSGAVYAGDVKSIPMEHNGVDGRWFPRLMVNQMQADLQEMDSLREKNAQFEIQLGIRMGRIEDLRLALSAATTAIDKGKSAVVVAKVAAEEQADRAIAAEESERSFREQSEVWYRQPVFCITAGGAVVLVVEIIVWSIFR